MAGAAKRRKISKTAEVAQAEDAFKALQCNLQLGEAGMRFYLNFLLLFVLKFFDVLVADGEQWSNVTLNRWSAIWYFLELVKSVTADDGTVVMLVRKNISDRDLVYFTTDPDKLRSEIRSNPRNPFRILFGENIPEAKTLDMWRRIGNAGAHAPLGAVTSHIFLPPPTNEDMNLIKNSLRALGTTIKVLTLRENKWRIDK
jgi:hypothetical protein